MSPPKQVKSCFVQYFLRVCITAERHTHEYIHMHTHIHTYIHTYIHTQTYTFKHIQGDREDAGLSIQINVDYGKTGSCLWKYYL